MAVVSLSEMMEAGAHFGHQTRRWNPKMSKYIYCARNGVHIIDLVKTALCMNNAYKWTRNAAKSGKRFLFVGTKKQASDVVAQEATRCGAAYVNQRWLGGMLTNWTTMKARIERLKDLDCDPIEGMALIAKQAMDEGEMQLAGNMYKELAQYVAPKRKSVEITGEDGGPVKTSSTFNFIPVGNDD